MPLTITMTGMVVLLVPVAIMTFKTMNMHIKMGTNAVINSECSEHPRGVTNAKLIDVGTGQAPFEVRNNLHAVHSL